MRAWPGGVAVRSGDRAVGCRDPAARPEAGGGQRISAPRCARPSGRSCPGSDALSARRAERGFAGGSGSRPMELRSTGRSLRPPPPLLLLLLLQVAGPAGTLAETLLDASRAMGASSSPPSPASVVAPGTTPFEESRLPVFTLDYPHVQIPFEITLWILLASLAKIGERAGPSSWGEGDRVGKLGWASESKGTRGGAFSGFDSEVDIGLEIAPDYEPIQTQGRLPQTPSGTALCQSRDLFTEGGGQWAEV